MDNKQAFFIKPNTFAMNLYKNFSVIVANSNTWFSPTCILNFVVGSEPTHHSNFGSSILFRFISHFPTTNKALNQYKCAQNVCRLGIDSLS